MSKFPLCCQPSMFPENNIEIAGWGKVINSITQWQATIVIMMHAKTCLWVQ